MGLEKKKNIGDETPSPENNEQKKDIVFDSEGMKLSGKIFFPEQLKEKNPGVIYIHGWKGKKSSKEEYAKSLVKNGFIAMTFDLRGHGESEGNKNSVTMHDFMKDVIAAYDRLITEKNIDPNNINVIGNSIGSFLTAYLVEQRKIKNIVLQSPITYPDNDLNKPLSEITEGEKFDEIVNWRKKALTPEQSISLNALHNFDGNVLVIESELDAYVPSQTIENYIRAVKNPSKVSHTTIEGAKHRLEGAQKVEYQNTVLNWLNKIEAQNS